MAMTLNNVPDAAQTLAITQPLIQGNFNTIDTAFKVDHVEYNLSNTGDQGKHNQITFPLHIPVGTVPAIGSPNVNEIYLFNQNAVSPSTVPDIWLKRGTNSTAYPSSYPITGSLQSTNGWSYLPSGVIIQWGFDSTTANSIKTITYPLPFPAQVLSIQVTQFTFTTPVIPSITVGTAPSGTAKTTFGISDATANSKSFYWFAVGV